DRGRAGVLGGVEQRRVGGDPGNLGPARLGRGGHERAPPGRGRGAELGLGPLRLGHGSSMPNADAAVAVRVSAVTPGSLSTSAIVPSGATKATPGRAGTPSAIRISSSASNTEG